MTGIDDPITAGTATSVTVTAIDENENIDTSYAGTIHLTSTDPNATLPSYYTFVPEDDGVHTFNDQIMFLTPGEQSVTVADTSDSSIAGSQTEITVTNNAPVANDDLATLEEGGTVTLLVSAATSVLDNDTDANGHSLTAVLVSGPAFAANFTLNSDGTFSYEHDGSESFSDSFTYNANDGFDDSNIATVTITIWPFNDPPTDISLDNTSVAENEPSGTTIGIFFTTDADGDLYSYSLVSGLGDDDNSWFDIVGDELQTAASFDYETKSSYNIRVRTWAWGEGGTFEKQFTITVTDVEDAPNEAPTGINLTSSSVAENEPSGTVVGTLSTTDPETGQIHTYSWIGGVGDDDNS